jgi:hypothetical protein
VKRRWIWVTCAAVLAAACGLLLLVHGSGSAAHSEAARSGHDVVVPLPSPETATTSQIPSSPSPSPPAADQTVATARAFLLAYASYGAGDTPDSMRARLRPYDTDRLDGILAQGAAGGAGAPPAGAPTVGQFAVVGLAPDGRLVITAQVAAAGTTRYVELYLASTAGGWRVDEVAL